MQDQIADVFVLSLTTRVGVRAFAADGLLDQQRPLLRRLQKHFGAIAVLGHGPDADTIDDPDGFIVFDAVENIADALIAHARRAGHQSVRSVVVQTHQLDDGSAPVRVVEELRARAIDAALVARGGYLHSRFIARRSGSDSPEARSAADAERVLCTNADVVVGTTGVMVDDLAWRWRLPAGRTRVVPNFVDDGPDPVPCEQRDQSLLLSVGDFTRQKQMDRIVLAVAELPQPMREELRLVIVGRGDARVEIMKLAHEHGVSLEVRDRMPHAELMELMGRAAIYLQASAYEGHPLALIEAMATGCPAIVANTPGLGNLVENGVNGIVVPGTPESFSYAVSGIMEDEAWREMLGTAASGNARRRFGLSTVMDSQTDALRAAMRYAVEGRQAA
ncbi:MAG: glycosyltransferase family 4 protein [Phycisphaerales bacterium JB040]